jgi:hypothetical protein
MTYFSFRSIEGELLRKEGELDAMLRSLQKHRDKSGPLGFLQAFHRQNLIATGLQDQTRKDRDQESSDLPYEVTIRGDLEVSGHLTVHEPNQDSPTKALQYPAEEEEEPIPPEEPPELCPKSSFSPLRRCVAKDIEFASLSALAEKRRHRAEVRGTKVTLAFEPFHGSTILTGTEERNVLYQCCPFKGIPLTRLLFATERDGRTIAKMHDLIDNIGITLLLIERGPYRFGGFATAKWSRDGKPFGKGGSSFLFSITRDAQVPLKKGAECPLLATPDSLTFGQSDLVLANNFDACSSVIEHNFGVGFAEGSEEAGTFLAGRKAFSADSVEVWGFSAAAA